MGWQDRGYNNRRTMFGGASGNPLLQLIMGSVPLGTWFGIRVRVHASLIWTIGLGLIFREGMGWPESLAKSVALFAIILLHEFGHCFGARMVGARAEEILLWPLGGLAFTEGDRTAWSRFVTVICGPLVNVILGLATGIWIYEIVGAVPPINPLLPFIGDRMSMVFDWGKLLAHPYGYYLWWAYATNVMLLFFNLLPIYPLDGGQLLQSILWKIIGYSKSMYVACVIGMIGAVALGLLGLLSRGMMLVVLAVMGFFTCYQRLQMLKETSTEEQEPSYDYKEERPRRKRSWFGTRWAKAAAKRARRDRKEQERIDAILAKVHDKGLHSLTWWEKRALKKATERQRQHDLAEKL